MNIETPIADLISLEGKDAFAVFTTKDPAAAMAPTLAQVRKVIDAWERPDVTTAAGRKEIASLAHRITKAKTSIEKIGEGLAREAKEIPKLIDATRRHVEKTLEAWRDEVRKPLTDWEAAEGERIAAHTEALNILTTARPPVGASPRILRACLEDIEAISTDGRDEFESEIVRAKTNAVNMLKTAIEAAEKAEAEAAELAALRAEKAERDRLDREADIAAQAAASAVKRERDAAEARERKLREEKEAAEAREVAAKAAAERAIADAEQAAREAEEKARRDALAKAAADEAEAKRRAASKAHVAKVNRIAMQALIDAVPSLAEAEVKAIISAIVLGVVPAVSIKY